MENVLVLLSMAAPLAVLYSLYVLAQISQRFGAVTKRPPIYRVLYVAMGLLLIPIAIHLLAPSLGEGNTASIDIESSEALIYGTALIASLLLGLVTIWQYWSWLIHSQDEGLPSGGRAAPRKR